MKKRIALNNLKFAGLTLVVFCVSYLMGVNLIIPSLLFSLWVYLKLRNVSKDRHWLLHLAFLLVMHIAIAYLIIERGWPLLNFPFTAMPMLATLLFANLEISFLLTIAGGLSVASLAGNHLHLAVLFIVSGIISSILIEGARRRITIIRAGLLIGFLQAFLFFLGSGFVIRAPEQYLTLCLNGIGSSIVVIGILPLFEYLFKTMTNISLLELTDFNHPLLQRMTLEAPGTYHHSLVVGNLSDAACRVVGANALLARIGAYYHDIGKLPKPQYFSENQDLPESKHDALSPTMSKLVIMNHVKEGVELALKHKLHPRIIDFIQQHHGTSLVYYFYRRALENLEDDQQQVTEEGFRYPGPKPTSREAAIVLLADSVEAATRSLKDPDPPRIEEVVHKIINNKFIDGQLDECELTLKDLEKIAAVFVRILSGIYHNRIVYPEDGEVKNNHNHKKSAKENPSQSDKDKKNGS